MYAAALLISASACARTTEKSISVSEVTIRVGLGVGDVANPQAGIQQAMANVAIEGLVDFRADGRPREWLAEKWSNSEDGLTWRVWIKPNASFHDGQPVTADVLRDILTDQLPKYMRGAFEDVKEIVAGAEGELLFRLRRRSAFLLEGLEAPIRKPGNFVIGTGPYQPTSDAPDMKRNQQYYGGKPVIDRIIFRPYPSVRAAWADMLRGHVDMLYEVGVDAFDSLAGASDIKTFTFERPYVYAVVLNVQKEPFKDPRFRRALNAAVDRKALIANVFDGHGTAADGPIPPSHWARNASMHGFTYSPSRLPPHSDSDVSCIFGDPSYERMGLVIQQQLQQVGFNFGVKPVSGDDLLAKLEAGDFDCAVIDIISGPNMMRPYWFWHSKGPHNWGGFNSQRVDDALDTIRHAADDEEYKAGVIAFQSAIIDDPPAIFLAWSERARAVSTRFEVPAEPGRDILSTLRLWRPVADNRIASPN